MATLDTILTMDAHGDWLMLLTSKGYLQHIIGSVLQDDEQLRNMLHPSPEPLRALYIFESKIVCESCFFLKKKLTIVGCKKTVLGIKM